MSKTLHDRTVALAALLQSTKIVHNYATLGEAACSESERLLASLLDLNPSDTLSIYGSYQNLRQGLQVLVQVLEKPQELDILRYAMLLMKLERKLQDDSALLLRLGTGLKEAQTKLNYFEGDFEHILPALADLYTQTISKLSPRVLVKGDEDLLRQEKIATCIRTHLLCGIRAAALWRQCGGGQLELLFKRKAILQEAQGLLKKARQI